MPIGGWIAIAVVAVVAVWLVSAYNGFIKIRNQAEEAFSTMDVYLKKRYDLIPNFVETVKGYAKHESETLEKVIAARNMAASSATSEERIKNDGVLTGALKSLFAVAESYPDLKANANFAALQKELSDIEDEIANSRKYYNGVIKMYNTKVELFPGNIVAGIFGFKRKPLYEVSDASERENIKVQF